MKSQEGNEYCDRAAVSMSMKEFLVVEDERNSFSLYMCSSEISCGIPHTLGFSA